MSLNPGLDDRLAELRLKSGREQRMAGAQTSEALGSSSYIGTLRRHKVLLVVHAGLKVQEFRVGGGGFWL